MILLSELRFVRFKDDRIDYFVITFFPSAKQLRAKSGKTMPALSERRGIAIVAEAKVGANEVGQHFVPIAIGMVLPDLQGKAMSARSLFDDKRFWLLLSRQK
jgi:hypothetical protein